MSARAGIVVTGTEVLTGVIQDRNGPWLGAQLADLGVEVSQIITVGDRPDDIRKALHALRGDGVDLIVTSGGLGPTEDDLTVAVVAEFSGRELVLDEALGARVGAILDATSKRWKGIDAGAVEQSRIKQSTIPEGAVVLEPVGTAPGVIAEPASGGGPTVVVLPGPPGELQPMWRQAVQSGALNSAISGRLERERSVLRLFGLPESEIAETMRVARAQGIALDDLEITTCLRRGEIEIDTRFEPDDAATFSEFERVVADRHGDKLFSRDGSTVDSIVAELLLDREMTLAVAESLTGGLMTSRLAETEGASGYLLGGIVAYAVDAKIEVAGVDQELIERHGVVSVETATALASGAAERFGADVGIGLTGEAGPKSASGRPVGTVCLAVEVRGTASSSEVFLPGRRADVRERSTVVAMHTLRRALQHDA